MCSSDLVCTYGSRLFKDVKSTQTDNFVKRLEELGFIIMGRTNTPEFGFKTVSDATLHGPVRNAVNPELSTIVGPKGAIPTLIISAAPFYARLVDIALNEIPSGVIEAAESMGANTRQIITKVLIPESLPALVSGITVTAIALIGSTAVAGVIGAGGLGNLAYLIGYTRNKVDIIFVATVAILILVFIIQIIGDRATKAIDKR